MQCVNISGASGSGKTTIVTCLLGFSSKYRRLVTYTSRERRPGEKYGIDYKFVSRDFFANKNDFVLHRERPDGYYAVKRSDLEGNDILLTTFPLNDDKLERLGLNVIHFFIDVNEEERRNRMTKRGDSPDQVEKRINADKGLNPLPNAIVIDGTKSVYEICQFIHLLIQTK